MKINRSRKKAKDIGYLSEFMGGIRDDQDRLREIQTVYDNLTLLGQLLCAGTDITQMRNDFKELADELLEQLAQEMRKKAVLGLRSDSRIAIDILIRNLFERTADIGFLATDNEIRAFAEAFETDPASVSHLRSRLRDHFDEYVRKYSVYHNIILLAPDGEVLAQLDETNPIKSSTDSLIEEALTTNAAYVETFRSSDLLPHESSPLIYSYRVMSADGSHPVAVLCLCFRFQDECKRIFSGLLDSDDWRVITLLDQDSKVIASSDPYQFPIGAQLEVSDNEDCQISRFAGREYLTTTAHTQGYQGYTGPGWLGRALAPLSYAFEMSLAEELEAVPAPIREGVLETATLFSEKLRNIPLRASSIQRELNRAVWNGNVWLSRDTYALNTSFAKVLLWEIGSTGMRTRSVFSDSTTNLYETVVSAVLSDCLSHAALAMDIMDRNLYERANDCRWWAMTSAFQRAMAAPETADRSALTAILRTINGLYTVYSNLVLFDNSGNVIAVSNPAYNNMLGQPLQTEWVRQTLGLPNSQSYCVSDFTTSPLYSHLPTYIYTAAIRGIEDGSDPVGGIAIVFDAAPQFIAMLEDALPRGEDGEIAEGAFAVFVEKDGRIIASTDEELTPGAKLEIPHEFLALATGGQFANIIEFRGRYYSVGSRMSAGYREYKSTADRYRNDVVALVFVPLSERILNAAERRALQQPASASYSRRVSAGDSAVEVASFHINGNWYGFRSEYVVEAIDAEEITVIPGMPEWARGCVMHNDQAITIADLGHLLTGRPSEASSKQIVVIRVPNHNHGFGILVDELGEIPEISTQRIEAVPAMLANCRTLTESLVKPDAADPDQKILVILSAERIVQKLTGYLYSPSNERALLEVQES